MSPRTTAGFRLALLAASAAAAPPPVSNQLIQKLVGCRGIADPAARLACLEHATAEIEKAITQKDIVVVDRETARTTRRSLFGFNLPKLPFFDHEETEQEISAKIASVRSLGFGKWRFELGDGAVWSTTEASSTLLPRPGDMVTIKRAAMGSYFIKFPGERAVRGQRTG